MACRLKKLGFDQFMVFENPALFYSYSFAPNPNWSTIRPSGEELLAYLHQVCEQHQIADKFQLCAEVIEMAWDAGQNEWELLIGHIKPGLENLTKLQKQDMTKLGGTGAVYSREELVRARIVISATGLLVEPSAWPDNVPGWQEFQGHIVHSAQWDSAINLRGKDILVVGTGSSAAQIVPELIKPEVGARSVTQLMRTAPWVSPYISPTTVQLYEKYGQWIMRHIPLAARLVRMAIFLRLEFDYFALISDNWYSRRKRPLVEAQLLEHMRQTAPKEYHEMLTPSYGVGCKRRVFDVNWLAALHNPAVILTDRRLLAIEPNAVILSAAKRTISASAQDPGSLSTTVPVDVIIMATGYQASSWAHLPPITGRHGKLLADQWKDRGGPQAYLGTAIDGFPNFFMLFGPNTAVGHSSAILAIENSINYVLKLIKPIIESKADVIEVKKSASTAWAAEVQEALRGTVLATGGCSSWYTSKDGGWNPTIYP
ncbi:hypothetical protein PLICBS_004156 [Purpureocillium lilacinum]|uniref:uncharacterized protein n=1 Tax=Purpureocillium lilacinum TaxID=33203 RepID=UPI00208C10E9|nr:hypothetical protein PLICBS_004156 [Purpureocillium lilacinum]